MKPLLYIFIMALVTYLIRAIPFTLFKKKITSPFFKKFFDFIPYAVLGAMTIPWMFDYGKNPICATVGLVVAIILAYFNRSLIVVAMSACASAFLAGFIF